MEWPAHLPLVGGGGVSYVNSNLFYLFLIRTKKFKNNKKFEEF